MWRVGSFTRQTSNTGKAGRGEKMLNYRHENTALKMKNSGEWARVGSKHYLHVSGNEVKYDCNAWLWRVNGGAGYTTLWAAKEMAENMPCACAKCTGYPF